MNNFLNFATDRQKTMYVSGDNIFNILFGIYTTDMHSIGVDTDNIHMCYDFIKELYNLMNEHGSLLYDSYVNVGTISDPSRVSIMGPMLYSYLKSRDDNKNLISGVINNEGIRGINTTNGNITIVTDKQRPRNWSFGWGAASEFDVYCRMLHGERVFPMHYHGYLLGFLNYVTTTDDFSTNKLGVVKRINLTLRNGRYVAKISSLEVDTNNSTPLQNTRNQRKSYYDLLLDNHYDSKVPIITVISEINRFYYWYYQWLGQQRLSKGLGPLWLDIINSVDLRTLELNPICFRKSLTRSLTWDTDLNYKGVYNNDIVNWLFSKKLSDPVYYLTNTFVTDKELSTVLLPENQLLFSSYVLHIKPYGNHWFLSLESK